MMWWLHFMWIAIWHFRSYSYSIPYH